MRIRRKKNTDENLKNFLDFVTVENTGEEFKNNWRKFFDENNLSRELHVELGTGKGDFITQLAEREPDIYFLGLEVEPTVVYAAARKIREKGLKNVRLMIFDINNIETLFNENEIDRIYINFCDPWPKKRHAKRRLTYITFLEKYKKILKPGGEIQFKTDNRGLFDFSLEQFESANAKVSEITYDLHSDNPVDNIETEYEKKFSSLGVPINRCVVRF